MAATIEVNKQSVKAFLETGKDSTFLIPDYQRPYDWTSDEVDTLFNDIWDFATTRGGTQHEATYFLGCIVSYQSKDNGPSMQEIIDGQQRITSLMLLLRAIYTKLDGKEDDASKNFSDQIKPCIWRANKITGKVNYEDILLESKVINDKDREALHLILKTGKVKDGATDNYSKNYSRFMALYEGASAEAPLQIYDFIYALLNQAIVMPISADTQDTALTIFSTLNDRGRPLSDADIFKAQIYNKLPEGEKDSFIDSWKELGEQAVRADESIQRLFYYYMFYLRAKEGIIDSTVPGVRKYYSEKKFARLHEKDLMDNLKIILNIWRVVNCHETIDEEAWTQNKSIIQALDTLASYPNEFWKYPVVIFYLVHRNETTFESDFLLFLRKIIAELLAKYLLIPTINAVKSEIIKLNVEIIKTSKPVFDLKALSDSYLETRIKAPHKNAVRMMLKLFAYTEQDTLLPAKWEIEHIFPQHWNSAYFVDISDEIIKEKIEHIGNKLPFEKKLNIVASNGYYAKKKAQYQKSGVTITQKQGNDVLIDWNLDNITERDVHLCEQLTSLLNSWVYAYANRDATPVTPELTEEQKKLLAQLKATGLNVSI